MRGLPKPAGAERRIRVGARPESSRARDSRRHGALQSTHEVRRSARTAEGELVLTRAIVPSNAESYLLTAACRFHGTLAILTQLYAFSIPPMRSQYEGMVRLCLLVFRPTLRVATRTSYFGQVRSLYKSQ